MTVVQPTVRITSMTLVTVAIYNVQPDEVADQFRLVYSTARVISSCQAS